MASRLGMTFASVELVGIGTDGLSLTATRIRCSTYLRQPTGCGSLTSTANCNVGQCSASKWRRRHGQCRYVEAFNCEFEANSVDGGVVAQSPWRYTGNGTLVLRGLVVRNAASGGGVSVEGGTFACVDCGLKAIAPRASTRLTPTKRTSQVGCDSWATQSTL